MDKEKMFDYLDGLILTSVQETVDAILEYLHGENSPSYADVIEAEGYAEEYWIARIYEMDDSF